MEEASLFYSFVQDGCVCACGHVVLSPLSVQYVRGRVWSDPLITEGGSPSGAW